MNTRHTPVITREPSITDRAHVETIAKDMYTPASVSAK